MMNNYNNAIDMISLEENAEIKSILKDAVFKGASGDAMILGQCYDLARLQALNKHWEGTYFKGFGDAVNQTLGLSESVASRRALVGKVFASIDSMGRVTYGKYTGFCFSALRDLAEGCRVSTPDGSVDVEKTLEKVGNFCTAHGITNMVSYQVIDAHLVKDGLKKKKKVARAKAAGGDKSTAGGDKSTAAANDLPRGKSPVEMAASTANIAEYGNMARMLAKTATAETLPLIIGMVKAYEAAVGVSIEGCTSEALKKIAGVDAAVK